MARLNVRNRVQGGFWRALEAVGVKDARTRWERQSPFLQRAVPPLVIAVARARARVAGGRAAASDVRRASRDRLCPLPAAAAHSADRVAVDGAGPRPRLPDPLGERADRDQHPVRDPGLQGISEHGHDGRDRDLRDDGDRAEHRRRLRGPARSRLRRLLRDRRLHRCLARLAALQLGRLDFEFGAIGVPAGRRRHPHLDLDRPRRRGDHDGDRGRAHRPADAATAGRLPRDRHARLRRDHPPGRGAGRTRTGSAR